MSKSQLHNIDIRPDDDLSWINWGKLIYLWLEDPTKRPKDLEELEQQWKDNDILASFKSDKKRKVSVEVYDPNDNSKALVIAIPTKAMIDDDQKFLKRTWAKGNKKYPVPDWYGRIYQGNPSRRVLDSEQEMLDIGYARLGEYVINECM